MCHINVSYINVSYINVSYINVSYINVSYINVERVTANRYSSVGIVTSLWTRRSGLRFPANAINLFFLQIVQTGCVHHSASYSVGTGGFLPRGQICLSVRLTNRLHLMLNLIIIGAVPPLYFMPFISCEETNLPSHLKLSLLSKKHRVMKCGEVVLCLHAFSTSAMGGIIDLYIYCLFKDSLRTSAYVRPVVRMSSQ
jgi:hypothetical protein